MRGGGTGFLDDRGAIFIEVLMAIIPILFVFLGVSQLALLKVGQLVVTHSALRGVRAAVVILDDDPKYYQGAPRGDLLAGSARQAGGLRGFFQGLGASYAKELKQGEPQGGARMGAIREAVYFPLAVLAPLLSQDRSLADEVGNSPWLRLIGGWLAYGRGATAVTLRSSSGEVLNSVTSREIVRVRVAFLMPCGVPLVSALMCTGGGGVGEGKLGAVRQR